MKMNYILVGSNDGISCEVLAISEDNAVIHNVAMIAKLSYDIVTAVNHYSRTDGKLPEIGYKWNRPTDAPLQRNLNQSHYNTTQLAKEKIK